MKKSLLLITFLCGFLVICTQTFAAPVPVYLDVWTEHRSYDQTGRFNGELDRYYTTVYAQVQFNGATVLTADVDFNGTGTIAMTEEFLSGSWAPGPGERAFSTHLGFTNDFASYNAADWTGNYFFTFETDDPVPPSNIYPTVTRSAGQLQVLDAPTASMTGNLLSWASVTDADFYRIRLMDPTNMANLLWQTNTSGTSFDLTGLVANGDYVLRLEARKIDGPMVARSAYFSEVTVTPVPGAVILLGSGLLGLVGLRQS